VAGCLDFETGGAHRVRDLELVTDTATYGPDQGAGMPFGVAVHTAAAP